jgi:acetyl esterase
MKAAERKSLKSCSVIDPRVREFLVKIDKDPSPFWELPQPKPQDILTGLQDQTPVDMSGVTTSERAITVDGRQVKLYIMKPAHAAHAAP